MRGSSEHGKYAGLSERKRKPDRFGFLPHADRPLVFGHRGYSSRAPENTLASFRLLLEYDVPGVELDIHRCASGELVVIHDFTLDRLSGRPGVVEELSYDELCERDVGAWFGEAFRGERIPLLEEVFELLGSSVSYDIEIKHTHADDPGIVRPLVDMVRRRGLDDRVIVSSFNPLAIAPLRHLAPDIPAAIIYTRDSSLPRMLRLGQGRFGSGASILKPDHRDLGPFIVFLERKLLRYPMLTWTVNTPDAAARLLDLGVDGIISDDPGMVMEVVRERLRANE